MATKKSSSNHRVVNTRTTSNDSYATPSSLSTSRVITTSVIQSGSDPTTQNLRKISCNSNPYALPSASSPTNQATVFGYNKPLAPSLPKTDPSTIIISDPNVNTSCISTLQNFPVLTNNTEVFITQQNITQKINNIVTSNGGVSGVTSITAGTGIAVNQSTGAVTVCATGGGGGASPATPTTLGTVYGYTTGNSNISIGCCAGNTTQTGCNNFAAGFKALASNTSGSDQIAIGYCALASATAPEYPYSYGNIALGTEALRDNTTGYGNVAIGKYTLRCNTNGYFNIATGVCALMNNTTGNSNIALGYYAGLTVGGDNNIAIGLRSLGCMDTASTASNNIAIGACAGCSLYTGGNNTIIGSLPAAPGCVCTLLLGAGTCERIKVDNTGLYINGSCWCSGGGGGASPATPTTLGTVYGFTSTCGTLCANVSFGYNALVNLCCGSENVAIGNSAMYTMIGGYSNTAIGEKSLYCSAYGVANTAVGLCALYRTTNGYSNTAVGVRSLEGNILGSANVAIGDSASYANCDGMCNTAIGFRALTNSSGSSNTAIGANALLTNTNGCYNIAIGTTAGCLITTGSNNTVIGSLYGTYGMVCTVLIGAGTCERIKVDNSGLYINGSCWCSGGGGGAAQATPTVLGTVYGCTNSTNTALGLVALYGNTTGQANIAIGKCALFSNTGGGFNVANGYLALGANTIGSCNTASGTFALSNNTTGCANTANGENSLFYNTTGNSNTAQGYNSLKENTTGSFNVAVGQDALNKNTIGNCNTALGSKSLFSNTTGERNTAIGAYSLYLNTTGGCNTAVGMCALWNNRSGSYNSAFGTWALCANTTGSNNTAIGNHALDANTTGSGNTAVGSLALNNNTYGLNNTANGYRALLSNCSGSCNVAIGSQAIYAACSTVGNIGIGYCAGYLLTTGVNNTVIGTLPAAAGCVCTLLLGAGTCERVKVDNTGLYINGTLFSGGAGTSGYSGFSGFSGQNGAAASSGFSGYSGISGFSGSGGAGSGGSRAIVDYYFTGTPANGTGGDEVLNFTFSSDYSANTSGFAATARTLPNSRNWVDIAYGNGRWVAIATDSNVAAYSDDGISWTESTLPATLTWAAVAFGNNKFMAIANNSQVVAISTDNAATWSTASSSSILPVIRTELVYGNGIWIDAYMGNYSLNDGVTWNFYSSWLSNGASIAYSQPLNTFVVVGTSATIYSIGGAPASWNNAAINGATSVAWGDDRFIRITAGSNSATYSLNGTAWTSATLPSTHTWVDVDYGGGVFTIIASDTTTVLTTATGATGSYNSYSMPTSVTWTALAYGAADSKYVAISGNSGGSASAATITTSATTNYTITLPAHGAYTASNLNWSPTSGYTPSQNATSLGNAIIALRASYTASYPSAGVVAVDTNSSGNITDTILVADVNPATGTLALDITQGGGVSTQDIITISDPGVSPETLQTYTLSPSLNSSLSAITNQLAYDNTLTRYSMMATADVTSGSNGSKLTLTRYSNGAVGSLETPVISVTTPGTSSSLAISRSIRSSGS